MYNNETLPKFNISPTVVNKVKIDFDGNSNYSLSCDDSLWMTYNSHNNISIKQMYSSYDLAYGDVLVSGLGFGIVALWIASKPEVKTVTVYEISKDVIDIFLKNNLIPKNLIIKNQNINDLISNIHYDCILLDHYELEPLQYRIDNMSKISKNIPNHNTIWFWSLESIFTEFSYSLKFEELYGNFLYYNLVDFYQEWESFRSNVLKVETIPKLSQYKINEYVYTYYDRIGYGNWYNYKIGE
jgi:hypothetical protein